MVNKVLIFLFFVNNLIFCQVPNLQWQKSFGGSLSDISYSIIQTADGGFISCGDTSSNNGDVTSNHGNEDGWVIKTNSLGTIEWQKSYGGSQRESFVKIIQVTDGFLLSGSSSSSNGDLTLNKGSDDFWIVKINNLGSIVWQKVFGGSSYEVANYIQQTSDGGYIITGTTNSVSGDITLNHGSNDMWVIKLNASGNLLWQKTFGGSQDDKGLCVLQTQDLGFIVSGMSNSTNADSIGNHGLYDAFIVKLDALGNQEWIKILGGTNSDAANSITQTTDGNYVFSGYTLSNDGNVSGNHGSFDAWIVKLNSTGTIMWQKTIGGTSYDESKSVGKTNDGGVIISVQILSNDGNISGNHGFFDYCVVKLNNLGTIIWTKVLGGTAYDRITDVCQTQDEGYIVCGYSNSNNGDLTLNNGNDDYWILKLSAENLELNSFNSDFQVSFFPNPTKDFLNINYGILTENEYQISLIDINGKVVFEKKISNPKQIEKIDISNLNKGIYLATLNAGEKRISKKLVID